jgi:hypothetical protein
MGAVPVAGAFELPQSGQQVALVPDQGRSSSSPDLAAENQELGALVPIGREKKAQDRECAGHRPVGQPHQHSRTSCRDDTLRRGHPRTVQSHEAQNPGRPTPRLSPARMNFRHTQVGGGGQAMSLLKPRVSCR